MGSNHLNHIFNKNDVPKTQLDELNEYLIKIANSKIGIRRKIVLILKYINNLKGNS